MSILIFVVILLVLVLVHEAGHFFTAKKFSIRVDEFGFGFPPKLFSVKKGETEYSFNLLPLGGFVKIFGENPNEENTNSSDAGKSFINKPKWQQAVVLFAGIFANFLLAWLLFSVGFMSGLPTSVGSERSGYKLQDVNLVVTSVLAKSPADNAGLKTGDKITSLKSNTDSVNDINPDSLKSFIASHPNQEIEICFSRGLAKVLNCIKMIPVVNIAGDKPIIGISMDMIGTAKLPFFMAFWEGLDLSWSVTKSTAVGLYALIYDGIRGNGSFSGVTGPVGMVGIVGDAYQFGFVYILSFAALISINLAIINIVPFPALDGGRLFFLLIEKIKGSQINPKVANIVNMLGFSLLIILMFFVTYYDVLKLF